jgi:kynurenine formamidase
MSLLTDLTIAIRDGGIQVIDLTAPLNDTTPVIRLPEPFGNTATFSLQEISRYDDRGPAWYWNDISTGEHTGTHFDAPVHWVTGKDGADVSQVPVDRLIAPAAVLDFTAEAAADPDFLLEIEDVRHWEAEHGPLPEGGWLLYRTGWDARSASQEEFLNANETGPHTPGISVACAQWLAANDSIIGLGVETVGTDAGAAHSFDPPFPCHASLLGAGKYGLTQLQNLALLPPRGAVVIAGPLPITGGSGSPCRAIALIEQPAERPVGRLAGQSAGRAVGRLAEQSAGRAVGRLAEQS